MGAKFVQIKPKWYAITLFSKGDFNFVVKGGPWIHLGNALLIKPLEVAERLSKIDLTVVPIWVHMYDVPWDKQTMANGKNGVAYWARLWRSKLLLQEQNSNTLCVFGSGFQSTKGYRLRA
jgi:hypothetical protein